MRIQPGSEIAGVRTVKLRNALGRSLCRGLGSGRGLSIDTLEWHLRKLNCPCSTDEVVRELVNLGYVEKSGKKDDEDDGPGTEEIKWALTTLGRRFLVAKATAPLPRKKADAMLAKLLSRAVSINANAKYLYRVERLAVFGSFLRPDVDVLGDLDIAYDLVQRYENEEEYEELKRRREHEEDIYFSGLWDEFGWPEDEVRKLLKARTLGLSLHSWRDLKVTNGSFRIVFPSPT